MTAVCMLELLDGDQCDELVAARHRGIYRDDIEREPWRAEAWAVDAVGPAHLAAFAVETANAHRWRLPVAELSVEVKRYDVGHRHDAHVDTVPVALRRTLAATVQLSDPDTYTGGDLEMWDGDADVEPCGAGARLRLGAGRWEPMPRTRGAVIVYPASIVHRVTAVTAGIRWAAVVTGRAA